MDYKLNLSVYSKYRTQIMGVSALMIIICHVQGIDFSHFPIVKKLIWFGNYGVEFFLFVSGFGMFYSLDNMDTGLIHWYKKRYIRILVPYVLITSLLYPLRLIFGGDFGIRDFLLHITTLEFWMYHKGAWFIAMLFPLYLITPLIARLFDRMQKRFLAMLVLMIIFLILSQIPIDNNIIQNIQFVCARVPIFLLGLGIAPWIKEGVAINLLTIISFTVISFLLWHFLGLQSMGSIPLLIVLGCLLGLKCKLTAFSVFFTFMGKISLESYLTNIFLGSMMRDVNYMGKYLIIILLGIFLASIFHKLSGSIMSITSKSH
ncbi:acyltransferase family protein [Bacteroides congonensis]